MLGHCREKRHGKLKFFQGLPYNGPVYTRTVITLSSGVRFGHTSTQNARSERAYAKNALGFRQEAQSTLKLSVKQDFLALKVKEHHSSLFSNKFLNPLALPFEGNSRDYVAYRH